MTTLHITVGDREQLRQDALQFVQDVEADDLDDQDGKATLQFGTYDDFVDSLTPLRLELIRAIAEETPESMREAARLVKRDVSDVHSDLKQLDVLGILTLSSSQRTAHRPEYRSFHREYRLWEHLSRRKFHGGNLAYLAGRMSNAKDTERGCFETSSGAGPRHPPWTGH